VLFEICEALRQHNESAASEDEKIYIDVLTGASAGGMTATIAAQKLLYDADALVFERQNAFYLPWVSEVSLEGLLALSKDDDAAQSILSTDLVKRIAETYLLNRYKAPTPPKPKKHPAAADSIYLGLALANLNGVDYRRQLQTHQESFTYTRHQDEYCRTFHADTPADDTRAAWEFLRDAAVSCGAFPFAFRPIPLERNQGDYTAPNGHALVAWAAATATFAYTDGGTFQNEPLGLAKNLVDRIDPQREQTDSRFYLFVSPGEKKGTAAPQFKAEQSKLGAVAGRLGSAIFQQSRFHDWIMAEDMNDRIRTLDGRAKQLKERILDAQNPLDPESVLRPAAEPLLALLFHPTTTGESLANARARIRLQYATEYDDIARGLPSAVPGQFGNGGVHIWATGVSANADLFVDAVLVLETAAHLGARDEMVIYGITALDTELASNPICAFGGFFDQSFREHDYAVGRNKARAFLRDLNSSPPLPNSRAARGLSSLGPIRCNIPADIPIDHKLDNLKFENLPPDLLKRFEGSLFKRLDSLLAEFIPNSAIRWGVMTFVVQPRVKKFLNRPAAPLPPDN